MHPDDDSLPRWVSAANAGFHAMSAGPDSGTRLSVKVVEYLSCGLPVIVNQYVGAAAELIEREGLGAVLNGVEERENVETILQEIE